MRRDEVIPSLSYDKNIFFLREKVSNDIYLKTSLKSINTRKSHYGINPNCYMKLYAFSPVSKRRQNTEGNEFNQTNSNTSQNTKTPKYKTITRTQNLLISLEKYKAEKQKFVDKENQLLKSRLKQVSSPYAISNFKESAKLDKRMVEMRKKIRGTEVLKNQEKYIYTKLPKIFIGSNSNKK